MSILELIPAPAAYEGRSLGEVNGVVQEGNSDVVVYDTDMVAYPIISVDPNQVLRPSISKEKAADAFLPKDTSVWKKCLYTLKSEGVIESLRILSCLPPFPTAAKKIPRMEENVSNNGPEDGPQDFMIRMKITLVLLISRLQPVMKYFHPRFIIQRLAYFMVYFYDSFVAAYASFYPYQMLSLDDQNHCLSRNMDWSSGVIRCFKWHPNHYKCSVALINDDIFVHSSGATLVPFLRHPLQKKVSDMAWRPGKDSVLAVACQNLVVIWNISIDLKANETRVPMSSARIIYQTVPAPITCLSYDPTGNYLAICGSTSCKILLLDVTDAPDAKKLPKGPDGKPIFKPKEDKVIRKYGHAIFRLVWNPDGSRLLTCPTSNFIRIFEKFSWSSRMWGFDFMADLCQACVWSRPSGKFLLLAAKNDTSVYALTFLDKADKGCVGGSPTVMKIMDVSEYELPNGQMVGGVIHDMVWDQHSERLVLSFRDNPEYLAVFKTRARPTLEITPLAFLHGNPGEKPLILEFHENFKKGSLLTIVWNTGVVSHVPFQYAANVKRAASVMSSTPRSLTTYCTSPTISSPILSPITRDPNGTPNGTNNSLRLNGIKSSRHVSFLSSDSVISPRKPTLFSLLEKRE